MKSLRGPNMERTDEEEQEEAAELERYLRRWIAFRTHSNRILKEMENIVSRLDCRGSLQRGELVGVDVNGLPEEIRYMRHTSFLDFGKQMVGGL